jgi:hypothetical protein
MLNGRGLTVHFMDNDGCPRALIAGGTACFNLCALQPRIRRERLAWLIGVPGSTTYPSQAPL